MPLDQQIKEKYEPIPVETFPNGDPVNRYHNTYTQKKYSNWVGCMYHLPENEFDALEQMIQDHDIGGYIIGHETEPYDHFHVVFEELSENVYTNMNKKIVEKYKLRGDSKKGIRKQYGKIRRKIEDLDRLKSYTVKDGNFRSNLSEAEMKRVIENSFEKNRKKEWIDKVITQLEAEHYELFQDKGRPDIYGNVKWYVVEERLGKKIMEIHIKEKVRFTFNQIKSIVRYALQKTDHIGINRKLHILWDIK